MHRSLFSPQWLPFAMFALGVAGACIPEEVEVKPPVRPTPQQETDGIIAQVRASRQPPDGVGAKLKTAAESVFARSFGAPITDAGTPAGGAKAECYAGGCLFDVVYPDRCAQIRADAVFASRRSPIVYEWPGPVARTPPIKRAGDSVSVTWALFITADQYPQLDKVLQGGGPPPPPPPVAACSSATRPPILERSQEAK